jgi:hypothetical protein
MNLALSHAASGEFDAGIIALLIVSDLVLLFGHFGCFLFPGRPQRTSGGRFFHQRFRAEIIFRPGVDFLFLK